MRLRGLVTLKKRKEFSYIRLSGVAVGSRGLLLQAAAGDAMGLPTGGAVRVGFTVSKKSGNAVTRNKIKRRLRVAAEDVIAKNAKRSYCYVLVSSSRLATTQLSELQTCLTSCLKKLGLHL
ncbi:ribonuclease P protein component [Anaplasma platys]|uniref:Ribonuclease P protein component n=1 Tax=Anaplasma platys TaxID=949 RepID=A0A858PXP4_9RICK|nr:ribonuclease P protein component [Anaplasma platys]QJC27376.1 ribonuclease P protein component [Anaplasma platys]